MANKKQIEFRDPVVERVVDKFISRSDVGFKKYWRYNGPRHVIKKRMA